MESVTIEFPPTSVIGSIQRIFSANRNNLKRYDVMLTVDLENVVYIEIASQVFLIVFLEKRFREGKETQLNLPKSKRVRDMLRIWRFQSAVSEIVGCSLYNLTAVPSKRYFGEETNVSNAASKDINKVEFLDSVQLSNTLTITTFRRNIDYGIALSVSDMWKQKNIYNLFSRLFKASNNKFARNIVYEAIVNAVRHPGASKVMVAGSLQMSVTKKGSSAHSTTEKDAKSNTGFLTLVIWDNGESIIDTLQNGLGTCTHLRTWHSEIFKSLFAVELNRSDKVVSKSIIESSFNPTLDTPSYLLLASAFLPGVSSNPDKESVYFYPENDIDDEEVSEKIALKNKPGMGLYLLIDTAIHVFGGTVLARTKGFYINIKKGKKTQFDREIPEGVPLFSCKIETDLGTESFTGNMLTIRIPVIGN